MSSKFFTVSTLGVFFIASMGFTQAFLPAGFKPSFWLNQTTPNATTLVFETNETLEQAFLKDQLTTNTAKRSIELSDVLGGGPAKDGIPALTNPDFIEASAADEIYNDDSLGVLVKIEGDARWYPFDILYWHEIINDTVAKTPVAVTFCPLCGSAITYNRRLENGETLNFGVSGKLWESNLLMYDTDTESLWSQIEGEAKVGALTGASLELINSQVITWAEVKNTPALKVQSQSTGYQRQYGRNPYGTYEQSSELMFPVKNLSHDLAPKTLMIAGQYQGVPFALERLPLLQKPSLSLQMPTEKLAVTVSNGQVKITNAVGEVVPTYNTMWFSWANHWRTDKAVIWSENLTPELILPKANKDQLNLIEYFSYGCSYCNQLHDALDTSLKSFPEVNLTLKHFIVYEAFLPIHEAQVCAAEQNQGYAFHDQYFKQYYPQKKAATGLKIAQALKLDLDQFESCLNSDRPQQVINRDLQEAVALGVRGTPTMLVEGPDKPLSVFSGRTTSTITTELTNLTSGL